MVLYYLGIFALMMALMLVYSMKKADKRGSKLFYKTHAVLFGVCCFIVSVIVLNNYKEEWLPQTKAWIKHQANPVRAMADELPSAELEPVFPLIEQFQMRSSVVLEAPIIQQYPQLPRGCEVTSLAMLLQFHGIDASKMKLADEIAKDDTPYKQTEDGVFFGNPAKGFVGDMYSLSNPGYGVYHQPIAELAETYAGDKVHDFSGGSFYEIFKHINNNHPVWVITNTAFKKLPKSSFQTWKTPQGPIDITMKEHSVLVTGYDETFIYFNDPLVNKQRKAPIDDFEEAWVQMGKQAITVIP
ncbi:C39 family peptidase [Sediminibacillus albus]|uniref:Uncharacterized protein YvpB n=1 Tax=Sediminibacillus albus TaxID=407036 RepID=A0A1G8Z2G6_9BACI|nr:C39 family peptidase [Sediminibacillus albus]SDK09147.1 Uncharacterized protein YvpB [Sediminibacillus albus]